MTSEPKIRATRAVGRYAVGIDWADGHDSIMPFKHLRANCPCDACAELRAREQIPGRDPAELRSLEAIGQASVYLRWDDGHETFYLVPELRRLCRCALCIGEPERPITG